MTRLRISRHSLVQSKAHVLSRFSPAADIILPFVLVRIGSLDFPCFFILIFEQGAEKSTLRSLQSSWSNR